MRGRGWEMGQGALGTWGRGHWGEVVVGIWGQGGCRAGRGAEKWDRGDRDVGHTGVQGWLRGLQASGDELCHFSPPPSLCRPLPSSKGCWWSPLWPTWAPWRT